MRGEERRDRAYRDFAASHGALATHGGGGAGCGGHRGAGWGGRHASHGHVAVVVSSHVHFEGSSCWARDLDLVRSCEE